MNWTVWLGVAVVVVMIAAITGVKPRGTRHVAGTRMMGAARVVLIIAVVIVAVLVFRS